MAAPDIEAIWDALRGRLEAETDGFKKVVRERRGDWGIEELPALMVLDDSGDEIVVNEHDAPGPVLKIDGELIIVARAAPPKDSDESARLNVLVRSVRDALAQKPTDPIRKRSRFNWLPTDEVRTLALTRVEKGSGNVTGQAVARITIEMETNAL